MSDDESSEKKDVGREVGFAVDEEVRAASDHPTLEPTSAPRRRIFSTAARDDASRPAPSLPHPPSSSPTTSARVLSFPRLTFPLRSPSPFLPRFAGMGRRRLPRRRRQG